MWTSWVQCGVDSKLHSNWAPAFVLSCFWKWHPICHQWLNEFPCNGIRLRIIFYLCSLWRPNGWEFIILPLSPRIRSHISCCGVGVIWHPQWDDLTRIPESLWDLISIPGQDCHISAFFSLSFFSPSTPLGASLFVHLFIRRFFCVFIMCLFFLYSHIALPKRQRYKYQCLSALSRSKLITEAMLIKLHTFLAFLSLLLKHVGGSYKKIGYYDSSQGNLSWFGNDVWIGKMDFTAPIAQLPVSVFVSCVMPWVSRVTCLCFDFRPPLRGLI